MHGSERPSTRTDNPPDPFASGSSGSEQGPDFYADFDSDCDAAVCLEGGRIWEGDLIRAIGHREYAHSGCADEECCA